MGYLVKKVSVGRPRSSFLIPNSDKEIHIVAALFSHHYDSVLASKEQNIIQISVNVTRFDYFDKINLFITTFL